MSKYDSQLLIVSSFPLIEDVDDENDDEEEGKASELGLFSKQSINVWTLFSNYFFKIY